jgi:NAD(P)-dependent dehydrogenase (short-subunit alcohol dehydrogenase family)
MLDNARKLAVVTGASTGIGFELAMQCAKNKFNLLIAANEAGRVSMRCSFHIRAGLARSLFPGHVAGRSQRVGAKRRLTIGSATSPIGRYRG